MPENKRNFNPLGDPGDVKEFPIQTDMGARDPYENPQHPPKTSDLNPNDVRIRPEGHRTMTDSFPDHPADLGN